VITTKARSARSVFAADIDGDGHQDVLSASAFDDTVAWYENTDGAGTFGAPRVISDEVDGARSVFAADVDGDGDVDAIATSAYDDEVTWYENTDGAGGFGAQHVITNLADGAFSVVSADVDGDGDLDVLSGSDEDDKLAWYENETIHRSAVFVERSRIPTLGLVPSSVFAADVDGDGDDDLLYAPYFSNTIAWFENSDGKGTFGPEQVITRETDSPNWVAAADIDGDGDLDALSTAGRDDSIAWYENTDGQGTFGPLREANRTANYPTSVLAVDLDGDRDLDLLASSLSRNRVAWYENTDGQGAFSEHVIDPEDGGYSVVGADVDGDGDIDAVATLYYEDEIAWYENDGVGTFGPQQRVAANVRAPFRLAAADINGDGDIDVVSASYRSNNLAWYENVDGQGAFSVERPIADLGSGAKSLFLSDLDSDGDVDVLLGSGRTDTISWYENTDGEGAFGVRREISSEAHGVFSVFAADLDGDGARDVVAANRDGGTLAWFKNQGGQFSLATVDVAQGYISNSQEEDVLSIRVSHNGRSGDSPLKLSSIGLRLADDRNVPLGEAQAAAIIASINIYLDDGSGVLDDADVEVVSVSDFSSITTNGNGILGVLLPDEDPRTRVEFGSPRTYLVAVELTPDADQQEPRVVVVEHRTVPSTTVQDGISRAEDANTDIELDLEFVEDVAVAEFSTELSDAKCVAPFDLNLENVLVLDTLTCEAGTILNARSVTVDSSGHLVLRAGQTVSLFDGATVVDGSLDLEIDPDLDPE